MSITVNPVTVTNFSGSFFSSSTGYVQGVLLDDPVTRFKLNQGMWGSNSVVYGGMGVTISTCTPATEAAEYNSVLTVATSESNLNGFTVFNQATALVQTTSSTVPTGGQYMSMNYVELDSGARIAVAASSTVAAALEGQAQNTAVYWDYTNQVLLGSPGGTAIPVKIIDIAVGNSMVVSVSGSNYTWNQAGSIVVIEI